MKIIESLNRIFNYPRRYSSNISELEYCCPKCDNGNKKYNLAINIEKMMFHCWACDYKGSVKKLLYEYGSNNDVEILQNTKEIKIEKKAISGLNIGPHRSLLYDWKTPDYIAARKYLKSRCITDRIISEWDIRYCEEGPNKYRIIVPSKNNNNEIEYYIARGYYDYVKPKYRNPDFEKSDIIFGGSKIDWKKPVIVTEGVFDSIVLYNSVPILGTDISIYTKLITKFIENNTDVILWFDSDANKKVVTTNSLLKSYGINVKVVKMTEYNDISEANTKAGTKFLIEKIRSAKVLDDFDSILWSL